MDELERIAREIDKCSECRSGKSGLPVPGEGDPHAKIMFIGMAPGRQEAKTGRPFVGRSGRLLTKTLSGIGIERKDVYITSPVKYYHGDRALRRDEIEHGAMHLREQVDAISPRLIVLLGSVAASALLPQEKVAVTKDHGKIIERGGRAYFITVHPSAALRFKKNLEIFGKDFAKLKTIVSGFSSP
jgi:DNA polymerase